MRVTKSALLGFIRSRGSVTFEDIEKFFDEQGYKYRGDAALILEQSRLVVWHGWNPRTCKTFMELVAEKKVMLDSVPLGKAPTPPIFRNITMLSQAEFVPVIIKSEVIE